MQKTPADKVLDLARKSGVLRARDLAAHRIPREYLIRLVKQGALQRQGRGLYVLPSLEITEHHSLVEVATRYPDAVVCLLSALSFHGLTTQSPSMVWIALPKNSRTPKLDYPPLKVCRYSEEAFSAGVTTHRIEGRIVKVYSAAKTVADCFKFRNKIGLDIAIEALRDAWRQRQATMNQIEKYAAICRVSRVMWPYLGALVG
ncbi:MAG: type IV toxin-antitoxin system AbiEi family antitoxin domain-containing protein [Gammaproteobacteria bacterium]